MDVEINLNYQYFPWTCEIKDEIKYFFKGTLFYKNELLDEIKIGHLLSDMFSDLKNLEKYLQQLNGVYSLILETPERTICIVDRLRSFPIFYAKSDRKFHISDDAYSIRDSLNTPFNECNSLELLVAGYVTGSETLYNGIFQVEAGSFLTFDKETDCIDTAYYYRYLHESFFKDTPDLLMNRLDETLVHIFERLISSTKGLQIVVPLSGGLDSRIIVAMLKRLGVNDVICFSYGNKEWPEAEISRQVAEELDYPWHYVEYTDEKWFACYHSEMMRDYNRYAGNLTSLPYIQDFLAIKELKEKGNIPDNAVFVPGHTDLFPGVFLPHDYKKSQNYSNEMVENDILKQHYHLNQFDGTTRLKAIFLKKIQQSIGDITVRDNETCADALELFALNERTAKLIYNGIRVYEFFGYTWRAPFCDGEFMDFFRHVPISFRIKKALYRDYARNHLFKGSLECLERIECTTPLCIPFTARVKSLIKYSDILNEIGKRIIRPKKKANEYDKHRYAMWGIIPRHDYDAQYSGITYINSFLALLYLDELLPGYKLKIIPKIKICQQFPHDK